MFCLECGTEMAVRARACPVCGHVYGDRERSLADPHPAQANHRTSASAAAPGMPGDPTSQATSTVKYVGDIAATGLPRDLPGRFVLGVSLGLAADLLLPWVSVNGQNVTPANLGAPVIVVVALLATAILPVFTTSLRQHPVWSALPLIIGAFCAGIAGSVWLVLAPLTQILAQSYSSDPSNLLLSPEGGLYLFIIGSGMLLVSGQRMLAALHDAQLADARRDAVRATQARHAAPAHALVYSQLSAGSPITATPLAQPAVAASSPAAPEPVVVPEVAAGTVGTVGTVGTARDQATLMDTPAAQPAQPAHATPPVPVLPGTDAWHQAPAAPAPVRPAPGGGWGKSRGPQRLR